MEWVHWLLVVAVAACAGTGWVFVSLSTKHRGWKSLNERMAAQVTQSAELLSECSGNGKRSGRLSTIR
ncbi:hypothetical protein QTH90_04925 [Variovorax sp. J2P1-59]|uniref:hypothetical protein n=1 Tax=Variovorax flavidus TaxID=3053501 RepID=UPI00257734D1|nr:hypothetical protein [Variovorax sp. J2P1-59]MDM0073710.1 hypothetical protein [Variovorax sp. J2P1-59]